MQRPPPASLYRKRTRTAGAHDFANYAHRVDDLHDFIRARVDRAAIRRLLRRKHHPGDHVVNVRKVAILLTRPPDLKWILTHQSFRNESDDRVRLIFSRPVHGKEATRDALEPILPVIGLQGRRCPGNREWRRARCPEAHLDQLRVILRVAVEPARESTK